MPIDMENAIAEHGGEQWVACTNVLREAVTMCRLPDGRGGIHLGGGETYWGDWINNRLILDDGDRYGENGEKYIRYNVVMRNDRGGEQSGALAVTFNGNVLSTVSSFDGKHDLAIIEIPDDSDDEFIAEMDADDNIVEYR